MEYVSSKGGFRLLDPVCADNSNDRLTLPKRDVSKVLIGAVQTQGAFHVMHSTIENYSEKVSSKSGFHISDLTCASHSVVTSC